MSSKQNSLTGFITAFLFSARSTRRFYQILREQEISKYQKKSVSVALARMRRMGYAEHSSSGWVLTKKGCTRASNINLLSYIPSPFKQGSLFRNTFVSFDIPEIDRKMRDWLRNQLKIFGYKMLQQSLWQGPGPLSKAFKERLDDLGIRENIKIFTAIGK